MDPSNPEPVSQMLESVASRIVELRTRLGHWISFFGARRIAGAALGVVVVAAAMWWLLRPAAPPVEVQLPVASFDATVPVAVESLPTETSPLRVHVAGAVRRPGVYTLGAGARVVDALRAAGGATDAADLERINLAQTLLDTEQVVIPRRVNNRSPVTVAPRHRPTKSTTTTVSAGSVTVVPGGAAPVQEKVNLNTATVDQLDTLPGVGPATAKAIVTHRTRKGPFSRLEDLLAIDGIGPKKLEAIRDLVTV